MNILDLKRSLLQQRQGYAGGGTGGVGTGTNSGMSGGFGTGGLGGVGTSTSNYGSRQGFAGATSYGGGINGGNGGSIGDGTDSVAAAQQAARDAASVKAEAEAKAEAARVAEAARQERIAIDKTNQENQSKVNALASAPTSTGLEPGWRAAKDSEVANKDMAKSFADKFGVSLDVATNTIGNTNGVTGMISRDGMSYSDAKALDSMGYGSLTGVNQNNPTQSVSEALASKNVNDNIAPGVAGLLMASIPGAGLLMSAAKQAGAVASGEKTLGAAIKDSAIDFGAGWTAGKINGLVGKEMAGLIGREGMIGLQTASSVSGLFGGPTMPNVGAGLVNGVLGAAGVSKSTGPGYASTNTTAGDNGFVRDGSSYGTNNSSGFTVQPPITPPVVTPTPATPDWLMPDINPYDGHGWQAAKQKYFQSKGKIS